MTKSSFVIDELSTSFATAMADYQAKVEAPDDLDAIVTFDSWLVT